LKFRPGMRRTAWLSGALVAAALAITAPGAVAASAQTTSASTPTLTLGAVNLNRAGLQLSNAPLNLTNSGTFSGEVSAEVFNGQTEMQPLLNGTERAYIFDDSVLMNNLVRGATYHITVKYTDPNTGQNVTTNTVTFTTPPSTDTQPPTTPTNLHFAPVAPPPPGWYQLEFNPSTDNVDPQSQLQYLITDNGQVSNGIGPVTNGDVLTVTAIDTSNNRSKPATITFYSETAP
jgi:hypothetical protein